MVNRTGVLLIGLLCLMGLSVTFTPPRLVPESEPLLGPATPAIRPCIVEETGAKVGDRIRVTATNWELRAGDTGTVIATEDGWLTVRWDSTARARRGGTERRVGTPRDSFEIISATVTTIPTDHGNRVPWYSPTASPVPPQASGQK